MRWEDHLRYKRAMQKQGKARDMSLIKFLKSVLPPEMYDSSERRAYVRKQKIREYNKRYKATQTYRDSQVRILRRMRARRNEACHDDINWVLEQFQVDEDTGRVLFPKAHKNRFTGYWQCQIWGRTYMVHRMVWMQANRKLIPEGLEIDHIDGNKDFNGISNLQLVTRQENMRKYAVSEVAVLKHKNWLEEVYEMMAFYHQQPYKQKYRNTMEKFGVKQTTLNAYAQKFSAYRMATMGKEEVIRSLFVKWLKARNLERSYKHLI
jgi:hypothetical protein